MEEILKRDITQL